MERVKLIGLCKIYGGKPNPKEDAAFDPAGIPFIRMKDLGKYHRTTNLLKASACLNENYAAENGYRVIKKGAILLPRSGSVSLNHRAILGVDASIVSHICALEVLDSSVIDNKYLYYYLTLLDMGKISQKTTGLDSVTFKRIGEIKIPVKTKLEQTKIVSYLGKIQELIDKRVKAIKLIDDCLHSLFIEILGDPILNSKGFKQIPLSDHVFGLTSGITPSRKISAYFDGNIHWVKSTNVKGEIIYDTDEKISTLAVDEVNVRIFPKNAVLIAMYGEGKTRGNVGLLNIDAACNQACAVILPNDKINPICLYSQLKYSYSYLRNIGKGGNQNNLSLTVLKDVLISIPPLDLQEKFQNKFTRIQSIKEIYRKSYVHLENLFQASLQNAFSEDSIINEEEIFDVLLKDFSIVELTQKNRLQYLLNWLNKEKPRFSNFETYDLAWDKLRELLEDGSIKQVLEKDTLKLKIVK
jgi:type I restriction enzyme S subunit